jgi:spore germination protein YaaH
MLQVGEKKQKKNNTSKILLGIAFLFILFSSILVIYYPFASKEKIDYFSGENPILFDGKQEGNALIEQGMVYVPLNFMKKYIDNQLIFDDKSNSIIITTKNKVIQMPTESLTLYVNQNPVPLQLPALKDKKGELYLALEPILTFYNLRYTILPDSHAIHIELDGTSKTDGSIQAEKVHEEKLRLRLEPDLQSPYTTAVRDKERVFIEEEKEDYYYIRKEDGTAGFLKKEYVKKGKTETIQIGTSQMEETLPSTLIEGPIQLTWEAVYTRNPDTEKIPVMPGMNVVSPTWFELIGADGTIKNLGSLDYVNWAKNNNYQVWGLFSNGFKPDLTHEAFQHFETRQNIIRELLHYSQMYKLDGINLDIENVRAEDGPMVTQFVREATPYLHEAGLSVSMDITFIAKGNWSSFYERDKLAGIVDYLIVMAYDEHWSSSPKAGSVASFPWVEENLQRLLEVVPKEKLILGVPLYTRLWEEKETGEISSKALSMKEVKEWLSLNGVTPQYDTLSGQNYAEYYDANMKSTYRTWIEDELSLEKRANLAVKYNLKGVASWSRYFADESAWIALQINKQQVVQNNQ